MFESTSFSKQCYLLYEVTKIVFWKIINFSYLGPKNLSKLKLRYVFLYELI